MLHEPQKKAAVNEPQEMEVIYEAVHEAQAQNTDDIRFENTENLENDMDSKYRPRNTHYNLCPHFKPTYNKQKNSG